MSINEVLEFIGLLLFGTGSGVVGSFLYFKPQLQQKQAEAKMAEIEADDKKHDFLEERIEKLEEMYAAQGVVLDEFRTKYISLQTEMAEVKLENITLRNELNIVKQENEGLRLRLDSYNK